MAISATERRLLSELADDPNTRFSSADAQALAAAGVPIWCLLSAAARFVQCGVTNAECQQAFLGDVLECFGGGA